MNKTKLKGWVRHNPLGALLLSGKKRMEDAVYYQRRRAYIPALLDAVGGESIITTNCFAGRIMQDLKMEYNSPTLGLYFMYPDYIEFLSHLEHYLKEAKIEFVEHSKYELGNKRRQQRTITHHWYPIGLLDGKVEIHFLHYQTEQEAAEKWYRRAARVNMENLLVIGMEQNRCTEEDINAFDRLPFKNKLMFSSRNLPLQSNVYMQEFAGKGEVGDPYKHADIYYRYLTERLKEINQK